MCGYGPVLQLLLLLLCLDYVFSAITPVSMANMQVNSSRCCLCIKAEIETHLLRKLYKYRLAVDIFWCLGGGLVPA